MRRAKRKARSFSSWFPRNKKKQRSTTVVVTTAVVTKYPECGLWLLGHLILLLYSELEIRTLEHRVTGLKKNRMGKRANRHHFSGKDHFAARTPTFDAQILPLY